MKRLHLCDITKLEPDLVLGRLYCSLRGWTYLHVGLIMTRVVIVCIMLIDNKTIATSCKCLDYTLLLLVSWFLEKIIFTSFKHSSSTTPSVDVLKWVGRGNNNCLFNDLTTKYLFIYQYRQQKICPASISSRAKHKAGRCS